MFKIISIYKIIFMSKAHLPILFLNLTFNTNIFLLKLLKTQFRVCIFIDIEAAVCVDQQKWRLRSEAAELVRARTRTRTRAADPKHPSRHQSAQPSFKRIDLGGSPSPSSFCSSSFV